MHAGLVYTYMRIQKRKEQKNRVFESSRRADTIDVVFSSLVFYTDDPGSSPGSNIHTVRIHAWMEVHTCYNSQKWLQQMYKHTKTKNDLTRRLHQIQEIHRRAYISRYTAWYVANRVLFCSKSYVFLLHWCCHRQILQLIIGKKIITQKSSLCFLLFKLNYYPRGW